MTSYPLIPAPVDAVELPTEDLAMRLLREYVDKGQGTGILNRHNLGIEGNWGEYEGVTEDFLRAMVEAYDWLANRGLIARTPADDGRAYVTGLGQRVASDENGVARLHAGRRLELELDPRLETKARTRFLLGDYEAAAFGAMREVEIRVRELSRLSDEDTGVPLIHKAFGEAGPLSDPGLSQAERNAKRFLFAGAIGFFKNPLSHRQIDYDDPTSASEVIFLADLLMGLLDHIEEMKLANHN